MKQFNHLKFIKESAFAVWRRLLYVSTVLITAVALILAIIVIPLVRKDTSPQATPEDAVPAIWVIIVVNLLIAAALVWTIVAKKRGSQINKELLVASGVIPVLLSLVILDGASSYLGQPGMHSAGISMFLCVGCDFIAGVLALIERYFGYRHLPEK
jgi:hypothetical protein